MLIAWVGNARPTPKNTQRATANEERTVNIIMAMIAHCISMRSRYFIWLVATDIFAALDGYSLQRDHVGDNRPFSLRLF